MRYLLTFLFLLFIWAGNLSAQDSVLRFHKVSHEQGLSQATVNCISQDRLGFLWFGTQDGLNRYDGYGFKVFRAEPDIPDQLTDGNIRTLCVDKKENYIWIGTNNGGFFRFDWKTSHFRKYSPKQSSMLPGLGRESISSLYQDDEGILWIGTWGNGMYRFEPDTGTFTHFIQIPEDPKSLSNNIVRAITEDSTGDLWIGTYGAGLSRLNREFGTFEHFPQQAIGINTLGHDQIIVIRELGNGELWIGTDGGGVSVLDRQRKNFRHYTHNIDEPNSLSHNRIRDIYESRTGNIWIATYGGGICKYNPEKDNFSRHQHEALDSRSVSDNQVLSIYEDTSGILWFGTFAGGVNKLDPQSWKFKSYEYVSHNPGSLSSRKVRAFAIDGQGLLWVGTNGGGLNRYDRKNNLFTKYLHEIGNDNSLSHNRIYALHYDQHQKDTLWIGTFDGGLDRFDIKKEKFTHYRHDPVNYNSISNNRVRVICPDYDGALWLGIWSGGVDRFDYKKNIFSHYYNDPQDPGSLSYNSAYCIYRDSQNIIWIGTLGGGLNRYHRDKDNFTHYFHQPDNPNSLSSDAVMSVLESKDGILWIGTSNSGLNRYDRKKEIWSRFSTKDGLNSNTIYGILEDDAGHLWLSTNRGLYCFEPGTGKFNGYDTYDGLQNNEFSGGAYFKAKNSEMFFGGINGFNSFFPDRVKSIFNAYIPPVYITRFKKFNRVVDLPDPVSSLENLNLSYRDNFISFNFVALNYHSSERNRYAYKLEGFDKEWIHCATNRSASYTNLDGGDYVFKVKASNNDGLWNETGASIRLIVSPPYFKTWWFRIISAVFFVIMVLLFVRLRTQSVRRRNQALQRINARLNEEINERKQVEEALQDSEEKYRSLFENSIDVHYRADIKGKLTMVSPSGIKLLGYDSDSEILGKDIAESFYFDQQERESFIMMLRRYGKVINYEIRLKNKYGQPIDIETSSRYVFDKEGNPLAVEGICRDVTYRKRAEAENYRLHNQLMNAKKMEAVGTLAGGMAHEFNNLMAVIDGNAHMLLENIPPGWDLLKQVKAIVKASQRCSTLTNQLLSFSKKQMLKLKNVNFNDLIVGLESSIRGILGENAQLSIKLEKEPGQIKVDSELMIQVILGIVENAHDAMLEGGTLTIKTETLSLSHKDRTGNSEAREGSFVCLTIADTGVGMDEETQQHIFEPFFTTKQVGQGTGLDLSFVYGTISQHNGWIEVDSALGKGTAMKVYLPVFK